MKRILKVGIFGAVISMLFTGCGSSSLVDGLKDGYQEIEWQEGSRLWETSAPKELEDQFEENEAEKYEGLTGPRAFKIKDGHSEDVNDLETFEIGTLLDDGTFYYCYTSRVGEPPYSDDNDNRSFVHCAAAYNYRTGQFKVFHENVFTRVNADTESFYMQMSEDGGDIFIYDNGMGYIYDSAGQLEFQTDIETFVRQHFKGHSVVVTNALSDGDDRIYVELVVEKSEVQIPEDDGEEISEEEADKEAEELDKEFDEKTVETVLVYEFEEFSSTIDQTNMKLDEQIAEWQSMAEGKEFTSEPDAEDDWETAVAKIPNEWGPAYFYYMKKWSELELLLLGIKDPYFSGTPAFKWNNKKQFSTADGYVSDLMPEYDTYKTYTELKENTTLKDIFISKDGHYYEVFGQVGALDDGSYNQATFSRTFKIKKTREVTDEKGNKKTEEYTETKTQELKKYRCRDASIENGYLEGYWTLLNDGITSVLDVVDGKVACLVKQSGSSVFALRNTNGSYESVTVIPGDSIVDVFEKNDETYVTITGEDWTAIGNGDNLGRSLIFWTTMFTNLDYIQNQHLSEAIKEQEYKGSGVGQEYLDAYDELAKKNSSSAPGTNAGEILDRDKVLRVAIDPQKSLLQDLENVGIEAGASQAGGEGYLITSFNNGLIFVDTSSGKSFNLDAGTWYGTWKQGDTYISVGFQKEGTSYGTLDVANARVMEYNLETLYEKKLNDFYESALDLSVTIVQSDKPGTGGSGQNGNSAQETKSLMEQWKETETKSGELKLIEPDNGQNVYEAWKNKVPGAVTKEKLEEASKAAEAGK